VSRFRLATGNFVKVPFLIGSNTNEGTAFGSGFGPNGLGVNSDQEWLDVLNQTSGIVGETATLLSALYPNIQAVGIPSIESYPNIITPGSADAMNFGLQFRRLGAYFGDLVVHQARRSTTIAWSNFNIPSYAFRFDVTVAGVTQIIGATHFQEVAFVMNNTQGQGYAINPFANETLPFFELAIQMSRSMSFTHFEGFD
jgi:carboxylesterase type B